ncbi:MAG: hypothetical protein ABI823_12455 [Bryobacteraceae bacterium]
MFFRREKVQTLTFQDRVDSLKKLGFATASEGAGRVRVSNQHGYATVIADGGPMPKIEKSGILVGKEIGILVNGGYQMFFRTPSGVKLPAQAEQLKALHAFDEDLREGLGLTSLYNEGLGTTSEMHMYDRVEDRDHGVPVKPWEKKASAN